MLRQCSLDDITHGNITRDNGHVVVCMHYYPRFLKKELRDEYLHKLAPSEGLLKEFNAMKAKLADHNAAFRVVKYEDKFRLDDDALNDLKRLSELAHTKDVYLVCQCGPSERCHRDLLLIMAAAQFGANSDKPRLPYPTFEKRLEKALQAR